MEAEDFIEGFATLSPQEQARKIITLYTNFINKNEIICLRI